MSAPSANTSVSISQKELLAAKKYLFFLLKVLAEKGGSDLYITVAAPPSARIKGRVCALDKSKLTQTQCRMLARAIMDGKTWTSFKLHGECNFAISVPEVSRFRVNAYTQRGSIAMVLRYIPYKIPHFRELKLPKILPELIMEKRGLVIFVGATGQGKSTTMASLLDHRNANSHGHIVTIEDPVEYIYSHKGCLVSQREVGTDTESFEVALKNSLRQAPDVILIGEVRDRETMSHAIEFAETGHLCVATLHANNTNQAMDRIINFFPEGVRPQVLLDLSLNLRSIVSQRLIPTADGEGRCAAVEILINTPLMSDLIRRGDVSEMKNLINRSQEQGMQTFDQALFDLIQAGRIKEEEGLANADSRNDLRLRLKLSRGEQALDDGMDVFIHR